MMISFVSSSRGCVRLRQRLLGSIRTPPFLTNTSLLSIRSSSSSSSASERKEECLTWFGRWNRSHPISSSSSLLESRRSFFSAKKLRERGISAKRFRILEEKQRRQEAEKEGEGEVEEEEGEMTPWEIEDEQLYKQTILDDLRKEREFDLEVTARVKELKSSKKREANEVERTTRKDNEEREVMASLEEEAIRDLEHDNLSHRPVMLREVVDSLTMTRLPLNRRSREESPTSILPSSSSSLAFPHLFVDATFGAGGHTSALLREDPLCRVIGLDRDERILTSKHSNKVLETFGKERVILVNREFSKVSEALRELGYGTGTVSGILFDLGMSSMQVDSTTRGFSFRETHDAPLDMRMGTTRSLTTLSASEVINTFSAEKLATIFAAYGEESSPFRIANAITTERRRTKIESTKQLADLVCKAKGTIYYSSGQSSTSGHHPATKVFQALRVFVNDELGELRRGLLEAEKVLSPEGRIGVLTYHSLEDRLVKRFLLDRSKPPGDVDLLHQHHFEDFEDLYQDSLQLGLSSLENENLSDEDIREQKRMIKKGLEEVGEQDQDEDVVWTRMLPHERFELRQKQERVRGGGGETTLSFSPRRVLLGRSEVQRRLKESREAREEKERRQTKETKREEKGKGGGNQRLPTFLLPESSMIVRKPTREETTDNPRARSAKLRIAVRNHNPPRDDFPVELLDLTNESK